MTFRRFSFRPSPAPQPAEYPFHVYLSHAHEDFLVVERLWHVLERLGMRAYMYEHYPHPGTSVNNAVIGAMRDSSEIVSFLTDGGASSAWVHQELGAALALGKPVVPVVEVTAVQAPGFMPLNRPVLYQPQHPEPALGELVCLLRADFNMMDTDISVQCPSCQSYWKVPLPRIHEARTAMEIERPLGPHLCKGCTENVYLSPYTYEAMSQQLALGRTWSE